MDKTTLLDMAQYISAFLAGIVGYCLGGLDKLLTLLILASAADFVTGLCKAFHDKKLNSTVSYRGIIRKFGIYIVVALAYLIDQYLGAHFLRETVIAFYIFNEALSVLENWGKMDLPLPEQLKTALSQLQAENTENIGKKQLK